MVAACATSLLVAAAVVVASPTAAHAVAQCSDGIDNDADGNTDYPADPGCASAADASESVPCTTTSGVTTCVGIAPSTLVQRVRVHRYDVTGGTTHGVAGYVDLYRFVLPTGTVANIPCVVLAAGGPEADPCAAAGGTYLSRVSTLVEETVAEPVVVQGAEIASAGICEGELVATVNTIGIASTEAYTLC